MFLNDNIQITLALVIVGIIGIVIWYRHFRMNDKRRRRQYSNLAQQSSGGYDDQAGEVLNTIESLEKTVAEDNFIHGNILEMNVLQGDLRNARDNPALAQTIITNYNDTLRQVAENRHAEPDEQTPLPTTRFMVDHIADFVLRQGDMFDDNPDDNFWNPVIPEIFNLTAGVDTLRRSISEKNKQTAATNSTSKKEFITNFIKLAKTNTNDSQNVHDSSVVIDYKQTLAKLSPSNLSTDEVIESAKKYIEKCLVDKTLNENKATGALHVLSKMSSNNMTTYNMTEPEIFKRVWERSNDPSNKKNSTAIKMAIIDGLYNCIRPTESGNIDLVCSVGRASNYMGALATLDADPSMGAALTLEQYKNELLNEAGNIVNNEVERAKNSKNEKIQQVALSYENPLVEVDKNAEIEFHNILKTRIDNLVNSYSARVNKVHLENIKKDCYSIAAID